VDGLWLVASLCTCAQVGAGIPAQAVRVIRRRSAGDLSRVTLVLQSCGFCAWALAAGTARPINVYLLIPNMCGFLLTLALLAVAIYFRERRRTENSVNDRDPTLRQ
jgi:hypothetical protein